MSLANGNHGMLLFIVVCSISKRLPISIRAPCSRRVRARIARSVRPVDGAGRKLRVLSEVSYFARIAVAVKRDGWPRPNADRRPPSGLGSTVGVLPPGQMRSGEFFAACRVAVIRSRGADDIKGLSPNHFRGG